MNEKNFADEINVLAFASYPVESAATRYRLIQFVEPLAEKGINLTVAPFLSSADFAAFYNQGGFSSKVFGMLAPLRNRLLDAFSAKKFDVLFVQREALMFGPPLFEWLALAVGKCPLVLDLDDATYVRYVSPTYGRLGSALKFFGKTDALIKKSAAVVCGNRFIAEYVENKGAKAVIIPTVADTDKLHPVAKENEIPVIGWIGTHSTFPLLAAIFPVLQRLAEKHDFILKIIGAGREDVKIPGVKIENTVWKLTDEIAGMQSFDIGLYPIQTLENAPPEWIAGKSGFKAIQYLAAGIPYVVTPVGVCAEIGEKDRTHFEATSEAEWYEALEKLLLDKNLRQEMGARGREYSLKHYTVPAQTEILAEAFRKVYRKQ